MYISQNLKFLRKKIPATQDQIADKLGLKKSTYASYETEDGNMPPAHTLHAIARLFDVSMDSLFDINYSAMGDHEALRLSGKEVYFPVSVDPAGEELIDIVEGDHRAQAGYLNDHWDPDYIQNLPKATWNFGTYIQGTKRIFQITGDSMLPIPSGSFVLTVKRDFEDILQDQTYVIVTTRDILFKRVRKDGEYLILISDNHQYPTQRIHADDIQQIWQGLKVIMDISQDPFYPLDQMNHILMETNNRVEEIHRLLSSNHLKSIPKTSGQ